LLNDNKLKYMKELLPPMSPNGKKMLQDNVLQVRNIKKLYRIGKKDQMHENLVQSLLGYIKSPLNNFNKYRSLYNFGDVQLNDEGKIIEIPRDVICAVNNVTFDVERGEALGIIGSNGAGKSTLLKLLSRITSPTWGRIVARGKISSLLEVGTGFHPELTGRENIYLNGTILGMRKKEIDQKFDQIVDFSGVSKFIETPIKRYSSGMKVRLAFSVAAHLDPDILIVDEVLAVGDAEFQRKCIGRMDHVAKRGKTVIFVSHDMRAISNLCTRVLLMKDGRIIDSGAPSTVIEKYLSSEVPVDSKWSSVDSESRNKPISITSVEIAPRNTANSKIIKYADSFNIVVVYTITESIKNMVIFVRISDFYGNDIWASQDADGSSAKSSTRSPGNFVSKCTVPACLMKPGRYNVHFGAMVPGVKILENHANAIVFDISDVDYPLPKNRKGIIAPLLHWQTSQQ